MNDGIRQPPIIRSPPPRIGQGPGRASVPVPPPLPRGSVAPGSRLPPPLPRALKPRQVLARKPSLLTPEELERFKNLLLFARLTVEGYYAGKHRSPHRGSSVEFTDYKEYVPGDEVNRIDWRAYGRSRRLFVRQYEAETDMVIYLLVDVSASMGYAGPDRQSKYVVAAKVAAALAYLMIRQGDKAALALFGEKLNRFLPPAGTRGQIHNLLTELERIEPAFSTGIGEALRECNSLFRKRGCVVILSDFWTDPAELFDALAQLLHRKFEILLLQVLDPDELNLPAMNTARFHDMETHEEVEVELEEIRSAYVETMRRHVDYLARECNERCLTHAVVDTSRPYLEAIEAYLGFRRPNNRGRAVSPKPSGPGASSQGALGERALPSSAQPT